MMNATITVNTDILGFEDKEMVTLKAYIYRKHWEWIDQNTGEVHEGNKYLTLITMVPLDEFKDKIEILHNRPMTHGVFIKTIGSMEGIIPTTSRVGLRNYQNHLESQEWKFVCTVPGANGNSYETVRKQAHATIRKLQKGGYNKYETMWFAMRSEIMRNLANAKTIEETKKVKEILKSFKEIEKTINT